MIFILNSPVAFSVNFVLIWLNSSVCFQYILPSLVLSHHHGRVIFRPPLLVRRPQKSATEMIDVTWHLFEWEDIQLVEYLRLCYGWCIWKNFTACDPVYVSVMHLWSFLLLLGLYCFFRVFLKY